jgi:PAS domain S-box-containing protein
MDASNMDGYAIVVADRAGNIQFWSRGAEAMLGHAAQDVIGRKLDAIVPETYREQHWAGFNHAMATGTAAMEGQSFDLPAQHRDGAVLVCPATFVLVRDGQKNTVGAMAILAAPAATPG